MFEKKWFSEIFNGMNSFLNNLILITVFIKISNLKCSSEIHQEIIDQFFKIDLSQFKNSTFSVSSFRAPDEG